MALKHSSEFDSGPPQKKKDNSRIMSTVHLEVTDYKITVFSKDLLNEAYIALQAGIQWLYRTIVLGRGLFACRFMFKRGIFLFPILHGRSTLL